MASLGDQAGNYRLVKELGKAQARELSGHTDSVESVAWSPDGQTYCFRG